MKHVPKVSPALLFGLALGLGLALRLVALDAHPLSEPEATLALQAYNLVHGKPLAVFDGQPGYVIPTALMFTLGVASDATARFWPALVGALVVGLPWLLHRRVGGRYALVLAFGLALDAGLVAVSRSAGPETWGLLFGLAFLVFILREEWRLAGIALGLAVLGGQSFWMGALSFLVARWLQQRLKNRAFVAAGETALELRMAPLPWRDILIWGTATFLIAGSGLGALPRGLGAAARGLADFLVGWFSKPEEPIGLMLLALLIYQPLGWFLVGVSLQRGWRHLSPLAQFALLWMGVSLFLILIYPARQVGYLVWVLLPLWMVAAEQLQGFLERVAASVHLGMILVAATLYFVILGYVLLTFEGFIHGAAVLPWVRWLAILGAVLLMVALTLLIRWGYSGKVASRAIYLAGLAFLAMISVSQMWQAAGLGRAISAQIWGPQPYFAERDLLLKTLGDVSEWNTGRRDAIDVAVVGLDSTALQWALRDFPRAAFVQTLVPTQTPAVVITPDTSVPGVTALYRGQDFVWQETPAWSLFLPGEWLSWIIYREAPLQRQSLVLWVRTDRFPQILSLP